MLFSLFAMLIGSGLACQTAINARLRGFVDSPFFASMVSFSVGTLFLCALLLVTGQPIGFDSQLLHQPVWIWFGGLLGVIGLTTNILIFPYLGGVQTAIMPLLGQILMGLLIDHFGWFFAHEHTFTWLRAMGAGLVLAGILIAVALPEWLKLRHQEKTNRQASSAIWLWRLLAVAAGMLTSMQTAINAHLGGLLGSALHSAFISFLVGASSLLLLVSVKEGDFQRIPQVIKQGMPCWMWLGGVLGGIFVFGNALFAPIIGTGQTIIFALSGLIMGSLFVDHFGLFGVQRKPVGRLQLLGIAVLMSGVVVIRLF